MSKYNSRAFAWLDLLVADKKKKLKVARRLLRILLHASPTIGADLFFCTFYLKATRNGSGKRIFEGGTNYGSTEEGK